MAMNKKEQAYVEQLKEQLRLARAFRLSSVVEPDIDIPDTMAGGLRKGYLYNDYLGNPRVEPACTSSISHCFGGQDKTDTQGPRKLYSTRLLALRGLRNALERRFAKILSEVDEQIEEEVKSEVDTMLLGAP